MKLQIGIVLVALMLCGQLNSQTSGISGNVVDKGTNDFIIGSPVILDGGLQATITSTTGQYSFDHLSAGQHTIEIIYTGYEKDTTIIDLKEGEQKAFLHTLQPAIFELNTVQVTA
ncbi:MAG: carboxypeptidase-like regulatory domain-containing protein [Saprospiraceae bacterium]|nr:carboxypeptidase-like regulatory domain-containing protein [Candidatus Opimibacter iunctus]